MMAVMIPVYVINALYLWPITLWTYIKFGRPPHGKHKSSMPSHCAHHPPHAQQGGETNEEHSTAGGTHDDQNKDDGTAKPDDTASPGGKHSTYTQDATTDHENGRHDHHHGESSRPMFATITVAVCHCGAGCVLGDIIGEWIVYGTGATINGRALWPEYLIDFAFAIVIGVFFQYFSIAPMAGDYGPKIFYRALKADFLSLLFFEIGLFGWMAIFQVAIFQWKLEMNSVTYWWMMQIGMFCGHWTGVPINWWLIKTKVKEPCT